MKTIYSVKEISKYLNLSESTVRTLVREHKIPFFKISGTIKFDLDKVNEWIDNKIKAETEFNLFS